jgi:Ca2+-binding EF-hand superfamily protein
MQERGADRHAAMFARADADGNGTLSETEMRAAHEARQSMRHGRMGEHGDKGDHDGKMMRGHGRGGGMAMLRQADTDGDKSVTRAEFDAAVEARFKQADSDGSGTITAEERAAAHTAMKERMQQRRDGK